MKKYKEFGLNTITDLKVFVLFLLDNIRYPVEEATIIDIVEENVNDISFDYEQCLRDLAESGHILSDEVDGVWYYMISEKGRTVSTELYDHLEKGFRERSLKSAIRHISLMKSGASIKSYIEKTESGRYRVTMEANDKYGELMRTSLVVNSEAEAEEIKRNFVAKPDAVYRGVLFSATGKIEFIS